MYIVDNIIKIFQFDSFICSMCNLDLFSYMSNKHKWGIEQINENCKIYKEYLLTK